MSDKPTKEDYIAAIESGTLNIVYEHHKHLRHEPFCQEIWQMAADKAPGRFINLIYINPVPITEIPNGKEVLLNAVRNIELGGMNTAIRWNFELPFREEIKAVVQDAIKDPQKKEQLMLQDFISIVALDIPKSVQNEFPETIFSYEEAFERYGNKNNLPELVRKYFDLTSPQEQGVPDRKREALMLVQHLNALHNEPTERRYQLISQLQPEHMFELISAGREEIFTSSFQELSKRLFSALPPASENAPNGLAAIMLKDEYHKNLLPTFLECCSSYGAMDKVLAALTPAQTKEVLGTLVSAVDEEQSSHKAVALLEVLNKNKDPESQKILLDTIENILADPSQKNRSLLKLVAAEYAHYNPERAPAFCKALHQEKRYHLNDSSAVTAESMMDTKGRHHQGYLFYNDSDGHASYAHMMQQYKQSPRHKIRDHGDFVEIIAAKQTAHGPEMHLLVGKPEKGSEALDAIDAHLEKTKGTLQSFVHRGHSYHLQSSLEKIGTRDIPLLVLGSCGGYDALSSAIECSPNASIVATQGTGTMLVNDPLLRGINQTIAQGKGIDWNPLWKNMETQIHDPRFADYVNPAENKAASFLRRSSELLKEDRLYQTLLSKELKLAGLENIRLELPEVTLPTSAPHQASQHSIQQNSATPPR
jgi:hypothetical protein